MLWLKAAFIFVGALVGFILERLAFHQIGKSRSKWHRMSAGEKVFYFLGIPLGLFLTVLIRNIISTPDWLTLAMAIVLCYLSVVALESLKEQASFYFPTSLAPAKKVEEEHYRPKLLDTNVIIDGRIADVCRAGFVEGPILVPKFIVEELQQIADSSDSLKRARGRRGLEILTQMQKEMDLQVPEAVNGEVVDEEVDAKLVRFARQLNGAIVTNDYNLNKVAGLQGVDVMNVNELANALKPVVLPGEEMRVTIIKEGKEKEQGIGYLDDGTMIVIEGGRRRLDETLPVVVTSVLQTVQGKMIFAKIKDGEPEGDYIDESIRSYSGSRGRRKTR
ncbi:MAG: TRAM domain-containing protein [Armatimonadetes bacterium]|nr:TRAM domain-containing protein [Armatimonadota bacterium]